MSKYCKGCGTIIVEARLRVLPTAVTCVNCSQAGRKRAITFLDGDIEHGATQTMIVEEDDYHRVVKSDDRDIADIEPDQFSKDPRVPLTINKRRDVI